VYTFATCFSVNTQKYPITPKKVNAKADGVHYNVKLPGAVNNACRVSMSTLADLSTYGGIGLELGMSSGSDKNTNSCP